MKSGIIEQFHWLTRRQADHGGFVRQEAGRWSGEVVIGDGVLAGLDLLPYVPIVDHFRISQPSNFDVVTYRRTWARGQVARLIRKHHRVFALRRVIEVVEDAELFHQT